MLKIKFEMVEPERKAEKERSVRLKAGETPVASMRMKRPRVGPRGGTHHPLAHAGAASPLTKRA